MNKHTIPCVLSIAGSDSGAGAGIQQDLKAITSMGCYATTVVTAVTAQNTISVQDVLPIPAEIIKSQINSVLSDFDIRAIKIGMIPDSQAAVAIADSLEAYYIDKDMPPVIYDPVMISTSGRVLMTPDCISVVCERLMPTCTLITPNIPEAECLTGLSIFNSRTAQEAGRRLLETYHTSFLIKGGHADGDTMTDILFRPGHEPEMFSMHKIQTYNLHGTGCAASSVIASGMALGMSLDQAVGCGKQKVYEAINRAKDVEIGHGNGPILFFRNNF